MVSIKRYIFLLLLPFLMVACGKNEFYLEFDLDPTLTENYEVKYYATDIQGGKTVQAVASVREGKCQLIGLTKRPTLAYLTNRNSNYPLVIYANRGKKIKISGEGNDPLAWSVEGDPLNVEMSSWRKQNIDVLNKNERDSVNNVVGSFVDDNPENPVSTLLMLCYYDRSINEMGYISLMGHLHGEAKKSSWISLVSRSDQIINYYHYPAKLHSLILRSNKEGADTLIINEKDPVMLMFWQTGYNARREMIDSIKVLEKEFADSTLLFADLCLDIDSVAWINAIRRDSLKTVKRFWVPTALADPTVTKFKIPSLPYFIIFDSLGNQAFRGKELSEAIREYRNMRK